MKNRILFFVGYFIFWILFFWIARLVFMLYNFSLSFSLTAGEWFSVFRYGTRMDLSMTGYIAFIAAIILCFTSYFNGKTVSKIMSVFTVFVLSLSAILVTSDMELYRHWGFRLDATPLIYLKTPKEAIASANLWLLALQILVFALLIWGIWLCYRKLLRPTIEKSKPARLSGIPVFLFAGALMIIPIRGSFGVAPMNVGFVYFHPNNIFANHAAINLVWNFGKSLTLSDNIVKYEFMDEQKAKDLFTACYPQTNATDILLNEKRPNVIIIILESFSNRMIEPLGGLPDVTPNLNKLCRDGILFTNFHANSDRTDKGIVGILNGYPAHPVAKVINYPEKTRQLPYINKDFQKTGYHAEFVSGFDIRFANIASYLGNAGYDKVITREDFPSDTYSGTKWGVPDHWVFEKLLEECNNSQTPFFKTFITLSSHEPFDVPMPTVIKGADAENRFLNSAYYTDKSLGDFIEAARTADWWEKTLIIITADHSSRHPGNIASHVPEKFKIPMLWVGGAVAKKDTTIATIAGHTDIPLTILNQLGLKNSDYRFSKDIFGKSIYSFTFYTYNNGFGIISDNAAVAFDNNSRSVVYNEGSEIEVLTETGKAYLQIFSNDFAER